MHVRIGSSLDVVWVLLASLAACSGCRSGAAPLGGAWLNGSPHEVADDSPPNQPVTGTPRRDPAAPRMTVFELTFDTARVEFPITALRPSRKIWNHLDLMRLDSGVAASLARNGLRVGVGVVQAWPAIRAIIESGGGEVRRENLIAPRGQPILLDLGTIQEAVSIFAYNRRGRAVGKTFTQGHYVLSIDYVYHHELGGSIDIQIGLEIRDDHGTMTWERQGAIIKQVPSIDRHIFSDVVVQCTLAADEFLVVGVDEDPPGDYLVGSRFLVHKREGERRETVLFLTPKIVETSNSFGR